ncbi:Gti1/Pac2 family-domain-containing protein [Sporodiniella umbellata]|nr:Gti1/Pac2 family-domain-containing protein [Sporodiniella umbellata]
METYFGYIKTPQDALIVFEACRKNQLSEVKRRLTSKERMGIKSGSVFAWDEREAGMRRWTDGRTWSPSRVLGSFLTYRELDTKRRPRRLSLSSHKLACSYKAHGLIKQSFSICTANHQKLHLISYYSKADILSGHLQQPSQDPALASIAVQKGLYPELNPLDTSGGHSATLHNMRLSSSLSTPTLSRQYSLDSCPPSPLSPPSLSSSPSTCDDEVLPDAPASPKFFLSPPPKQPLPQDIIWERIPHSEDQRQLKQLHTLLRL